MDILLLHYLNNSPKAGVILLFQYTPAELQCQESPKQPKPGNPPIRTALGDITGISVKNYCRNPIG